VRFPVYTQWKKDWHSAYTKKGWFKTKTGFICSGIMSRNDAINYPVQGSAFHCLLWSLTDLVLHGIKRAGMKALIVGQIHDSIVADVPDSEVDDFLRLVHHTTTTKLREAFRWINVPLDVEADVCPLGGSWADKESYKIPV
jgi:DNA polymerase I-like protein with 3'-5' exonuclease and polymerase domains